MYATRKSAALLFLALSPALSPAQGRLVLPSDAQDFRELTRPAPGQACEMCGVVTDIRSEKREVRKMPDAAMIEETAGDPVATPLLVGGKGGFRRARLGEAGTIYVVTVRLDDGGYASYEQDDEPTLRKGERIEVREGRVEPR